MMSKFHETMSQRLGPTLRDDDFAESTKTALRPFGFTADNAIACVATCRDEVCRPVREHIQRAWGEAFNLSSLAGMLTLGRTGFAALHGHAPTTFPRRQHVYFGMPHIGIGADGEIGVIERPGMSETSQACGALFALAAEAAAGPIDQAFDPADPEQSILRMRLAPSLDAGERTDPIELVELAARQIHEDFEAAVAESIDAADVDYAVFVGIQVHGPDRQDYVAPRVGFAVVSGTRHDLELT